MSDRFQPVTMEQLARWVFAELEGKGSIFGLPRAHFFVPREDDGFRTSVYGHPLETPFGVAAGPHSQMAQNIVAAWLCGARFVELKTVQVLDELEVSRPCIDSADETFNCEWSQELKLEQSFDEYLKAWVLVHALAAKLGLPEPGTLFAMSVGYNLEGIRSERVQRFIASIRDASASIPAAVEAVAKAWPGVRDVGVDENTDTWWGAAVYAKYQLTDVVSIALRGEYFHDDDGTARVQDLDGNYWDNENWTHNETNAYFVNSTDLWSFTATVGFDLWENMLMRLEYRLDIASPDGGNAIEGGDFQEDDDDELDPGALREDRGHLLARLAGPGEDHPGARVPEDERDLRLAARRVDRHRDAADAENGEVGDRPVRLVRREDRHAIPLADPRVDEARGERADARRQRPPGNVLPGAGGEMAKGRLVAASGHPLEKDVGNVPSLDVGRAEGHGRRRRAGERRGGRRNGHRSIVPPDGPAQRYRRTISRPRSLRSTRGWNSTPRRTPFTW